MSILFSRFTSLRFSSFVGTFPLNSNFPLPYRMSTTTATTTTSAIPESSDNQDRLVFGMIGEKGFQDITASFYRRIVVDDILLPMYQQSQQLRGEPDLSLSESRLREYLVGRFGGPQRYIETHGHPRLRWRHMDFPIDRTARDRWFQLMDESLIEALGDDRTTVPYKELSLFFKSMSQFLINCEEYACPMSKQTKK